MFMSAFNPALWWLKRASRAGSWVVVDQSSGACSPKVGMRRLIAKARGAVAGRIIDRIIAVSEFVARRDVEQNMLPLDRVTTIYNGVDLGRFRAESIRAAKDGAFTIVFAGQLIPEKGVDLLVEAVRRVAAAPGARLEMKVAGTGRLRGELERLASEVLPGRVEFLGQVEDVPALFRSADLAIFPSRWQEAFGLVIAEAMACRTPVIASDAGGIPEVVGADGLAGLVFRNGDVDGLERQIRILLADPERRARMGQAGRERVEREFSITRMVEKYAALYEELAMQTGR
jgi:glycosyltransferase involved in cell wall biosynthesis